MKILMSGDHHHDEHSSRWGECLRIHRWMADVVREERPDVFLSGGDIYERASTPAERQAVAEWLTEIAEVCQVIAVKGNHDRPLDAQLLGRLKTKHPVTVEERCGVHWVGDVAIQAVAWPSASALAASVGQAVSSEARNDVAREALRNVFRGLAVEARAASTTVLLIHAMIDGSVTSTGQPLVGAELNVGLDDLALAGAGIVLASHIHKPQEWLHGETPMVYAGSPFRTAYGEMEEKSIVCVETDEGCPLTWRRIASPAMPMVLITAAWRSGAFEITSKEIPSAARVVGAEVRLRYETAADERTAAASAARAMRDGMLEAGAVRVKVEEEVVTVARAPRAPELAAATSLEEKLRVLWKCRGAMPDDARASRLLGKLADLEGDSP